MPPCCGPDGRPGTTARSPSSGSLDGPPIPTQGRLESDGDARLDLHRELVRRLRRPLREGDTPARIAEDDFVVLLDDVGPGGVPARLSLLLDQLRQELGSRLAIGVLGSIRGFRDVGEVLREADITLLRGASRAGSLRVRPALAGGQHAAPASR